MKQVILLYKCYAGSTKANGREPKTCLGQVSTISLAVSMMWMYASMLMHAAHIYSSKLGPHLVLLDNICPCYMSAIAYSLPSSIFKV